MAGAVARLLALATVLVAAGCGGGDASREQRSAAPWLDPDGEFPIVGSLAVNPADGELWMATNTGLFRVDGSRPVKVSGQLRTERGVGELSEQLVVSFTGPDAMVASGHPAAGDALPPALGLIRSGDAGRTWDSVSELGTADFHALERSGSRLVAALSGQAQVLVSEDDGRRWEARMAPGVIVDLAVHPGRPSHWVASTAEGVFLSRDEGGSWRPVDSTPNARFAWPGAGTLYRLDPGGELMASADGGGSWTQAGSTGGEPQALAAADPRTLFALLLDGTVRRSGDGGRTWTDHVPAPRR